MEDTHIDAFGVAEERYLRKSSDMAGSEDEVCDEGECR